MLPELSIKFSMKIICYIVCVVLHNLYENKTINEAISQHNAYLVSTFINNPPYCMAPMSNIELFQNFIKKLNLHKPIKLNHSIVDGLYYVELQRYMHQKEICLAKQYEFKVQYTIHIIFYRRVRRIRTFIYFLLRISN